MIVLQVQALGKAFGDTEILKDVSFSVEERDRIGIVGPNGAGKTTLLRLLSWEMEPDGGSIALKSGYTLGYLHQGMELDTDHTVFQEMLEVFAPVFRMEERMRELEGIMGEVDQTSDAYDSAVKEYDSLLDRFEKAGGYSYKSSIAGVLTGLGMAKETFDQPIWQLSGGQKARVALGKLLLIKPDILLLDEPTNHLDLQAAAWLEGYLRSFPGIILVVSHDRWFLDAVCRRIFEISFQRLTVFEGNFTAYLGEREERYQQQLKAYQLNQKEIQRKEAIISRYRSFNREKSIKAARSWEKKLDKMERLDKPRTQNSIFFNFDISSRSGNDVLITENLGMVFDGRPLFHGLNLHLLAGDRVAVVGPNGVGKTTLLRILNGQLLPSEGTFLLGTGVKVGYYDQHQSNLNPGLTPMDEIWQDYVHTMDQTQVRSALAAFLFRGEDVTKKISELSGGEKARITLLKLMLGKGNLLLLDEPTNHLDIDSRQVLEEALCDFPGTVILVSHDRYFINRVATKVLEFTDDGFLQYDGNWDDYLYHQSLMKEEQESPAGNLTKTAQAKERKKTREEKERLKELRRALTAAEDNVTRIEEEKATVEARLAQPENLTGEDIAALTQQYTNLDRALAAGIEEWEQASADMEEGESESGDE